MWKKKIQFRGPESAMSLFSICDSAFDMSYCVVSNTPCSTRKDIIKKTQSERSAQRLAN